MVDAIVPPATLAGVLAVQFTVRTLDTESVESSHKRKIPLTVGPHSQQSLRTPRSSL